MLPSAPRQQPGSSGQDGFHIPSLASLGLLPMDDKRGLRSSVLEASTPSSSATVTTLKESTFLHPLSHDLLQIQSLLPSRGEPSQMILNVEMMPSYLHHVRRLHLANNTTLNLSVPPPQSVRMLRHERHALETEALILSLLRAVGLPVASVVRHDPTGGLLGTPFLLTTSLPGVPLSAVLLSRSAPQGAQRTAVEADIRRLVNMVSSHSALMFGPAPLVATGKGFDRWRDAFRAMLGDAVKDAEDAFVHLPYSQVWEAVDESRAALDEVRESKLVVPGLGKASNVLVQAASNGGAQVTGLLGFQGAFWGDPEMGLVVDDGPEGRLEVVDTDLFVQDNRRRRICLLVAPVPLARQSCTSTYEPTNARPDTRYIKRS